MAARWLPLSLLLPLSQAIPVHADLKISIHAGIRRETRYMNGRSFRTDAGDAFGAQWIFIGNGDQQLQYTLDPSTHTYSVRRVEPWKPNPLLRARDSGKTIDIYRNYVDTGERRWMFGHLARHVILSERRVPEASSCSAKEGERRTKTDGWYIDLPARYQGAGSLGMDAGAFCPNGALDRIEIHTTGHRENGFPLLETVTSPDWPRATVWTRVVEFDESPLDPKIFVPPAGYRQGPGLPQHSHSSFLDTLRYRLSGWVSAAEEWIE